MYKVTSSLLLLFHYYFIAVILLFNYCNIISIVLSSEPIRDINYIDPNKYFSPNANNEEIQQMLRKYDTTTNRYNNELLDYNNVLNNNNNRYQQQQQQPQQHDEPFNRRYPSNQYNSHQRQQQVDIQNLGATGQRTGTNYDVRYDVANIDNNNNNNNNQLLRRGQYDYSTQSPRTRIDQQPRQYFDQDPRYSLKEDEIFKILNQIDLSSSQQCNINVRAQWDFETNVNDVTQTRALEQQLAYLDFQRKVHNIIDKIDYSDVRDAELVRQLRHLSVVGPAALPTDQLNRYNRIINDMLAVYNTATICAHEEPLKCGLRLDPDLNIIMARSRDWDELQHTWIEWNRRAGQKVRDYYEQLVELSNFASRLNNFTDTADYWTFPFESVSFRSDMEVVWNQIRPLYELLHAYVRRKLRDLYGPEKISREAPLPAHVLGNMWGQSWENILDVTIPYPGKNFLDVTPEMIRQGYTPEAMFRIAENFFISLNMSAMPPEFWSKSVFEEIPGRPVVCQPSAWDFCNGIDYRIKMCTQITMKDFITVHHEMAHIEYFLSYRRLPKVYRDGANPGFHEAISEAVALSVGSPQHMQTLGLVMKAVDDIPHNINYLFALAMDKLTFLPFSLALDMWRWDIFKGYTGKERYNCHWWDLRERLSGVKPPVLRSEIDFDPGSKYHVPAHIPYIGYYFGTVLQFQIFRAMCKAAGQYTENDPRKPLHKCDIYRSKEAGDIMKRLMEAGSSMRWQDALQSVIGESRLDASALREYFKPLEEWLRNENLRTNEFVGWVYDGDYCKYSIETANLQVYGGFYNTGSSLNNNNNNNYYHRLFNLLSLTVLLFLYSFLSMWNVII